mmetsp:Transcript_13575/g.29345  ORF Transcript_13575/g.29345 Transcript_13575/m.29345 type:complete len:201 (+) Transcript_13575:643-1245(+)
MTGNSFALSSDLPLPLPPLRLSLLSPLLLSGKKVRQQYPPSDRGQRAAVRRANASGAPNPTLDEEDESTKKLENCESKPALATLEEEAMGTDDELPLPPPTISASGIQLFRNNVHDAPLSFPSSPFSELELSSIISEFAAPPLFVLGIFSCRLEIKRCNSRGSINGRNANASSDVSNSRRIIAESSDVAGVYGDMDRKDS